MEDLIRIVFVALVLIAFDVVTGIVSAFATGTFKSSIMREGGWHKLTLVLAIGFGVFLNYAQTIVDIGVNIPVGNGICFYVILMECCSIIENINRGFPGAIPASILKAFNTAKDAVEEEKNDH